MAILARDVPARNPSPSAELLRLARACGVSAARRPIPEDVAEGAFKRLVDGQEPRRRAALIGAYVASYQAERQAIADALAAEAEREAAQDARWQFSPLRADWLAERASHGE